MIVNDELDCVEECEQHRHPPYRYQRSEISSLSCSSAVVILSSLTLYMRAIVLPGHTGISFFNIICNPDPQEFEIADCAKCQPVVGIGEIC